MLRILNAAVKSENEPSGGPSGKNKKYRKVLP
jgi:hypothetical protein